MDNEINEIVNERKKVINARLSDLDFDDEDKKEIINAGIIDIDGDTKEKLYETLVSLEQYKKLIADKYEYYKEWLTDELYNDLENLIKEITLTIDETKSKIKLSKNDKELKEFQYAVNFKAFTIICEINNYRAAADGRYMEENYKDNADKLLKDTKNILKSIKNKELKLSDNVLYSDIARNMTKEDEIGFLYQYLSNRLNLQYSGVLTYFQDTNVYDKFERLIINKIENVLDIEIDKNLQPIPRKTPLSPFDLALVPMPIYQTAEINNFIGFNYKQKDKKPTPKKGNYLDNRLKNPTVEITKGKNTVQIDLSKLEISKSVKLDPKVHMTFIILLSELTKKIPHDAKICDLEAAAKYMSVSISLRDYMEIRNLKDMKSARSQLRESLEMLHAASLSYTRIDKKGKEIVEKFHIIDYFKYELNKGIAHINISPTLILHVALKKQLQNYNRNLLTINIRTNPKSFNLGHELLADARRNKNKDNRNIDGVFIINTKKLLDVCGLKYDKHFTTRVLERFESDMDALVFDYNVLKSWNLCKKNREPLTDAELSELNYETFLETYVLYEPAQRD